MRYVYAVVGGVIIVLGVTVWWILGTMNHAAGTSDLSVTFVVAKGEQLRQVATRLEDQHLIDSAGAWTLYAITTGQRSAILPGTYTLHSSMTGRTVLQMLTTNPLKSNEVTVTIREGLTLAQIADVLQQAGVVQSDEFLTVVHTPKAAGLDLSVYRIASQKPSTVDLEGYIYPDTYRFYKNSTGLEVVKKLLTTLDDRFTDSLVQTTLSSGHTPHEILTMASVLEKEGNNVTDWGMIADIFWRRIAAGIPMQSDATVNYALGLTNQATTSIADTKTASPYNTYLNKGLPPGPIDNPGIETIRAALQPTANMYWYFLTANSKAVFATTLAEHNANKVKYLK